MLNMAATFVILVSDLFFEKLPNTYPMINTMQVIKSTLVKMIPINITLHFKSD